ncbi:arginine deiminase type-3 [Pochonia chlamydosporia 170]|uniref:Arginine deiminase type-3 n=1 Tax=Pochonia chlamydosporia 170 TaxID=1380566 RepID=A0A179F1T8_METCM|nr:arginine deiminase type-3 [Pochonia chlamydosporia 170]OAQ59341.1 arginine deiminase type-3 [Pochonia chlamydosporia 170]
MRHLTFVLLNIFGIQQAVLAARNESSIQCGILADTNRDGIVDDLDRDHKHMWTSNYGAIFLPNIGDEHRRCAIRDGTGISFSNEELAACNDATGDRLITTRYAAKLRTDPVQGLSGDAVGKIYTDPPSSLSRVRVFWLHGNSPNVSSDWTLVQPELSFNSTALSKGLILAIDGRELTTGTNDWNGRVDIVFKVTDSGRTATDFVAMRQAPILVHHHLHKTETVVTLQTRQGVSKWQAPFVEKLRGVLGNLDSQPSLLVLNNSYDVWGQDFMEPAFASMPGPNGPVSLRVLLRSPQSTRRNGRKVFEQLRGPGVGGWQPGLGTGFGWEEINSGGNMETIPPYVSRSGVRYRNGRVLLGKHFDTYPAQSWIDFLESQGEQPPLFLEAGWLVAGHIDEMVQFLPYNNTLGFKMAVPDMRSAIATLKNLNSTGHGAVPALSYDGDMTPDTDAIFLDPSVRNKTVSSLLSDERFIWVNEYAQKYVDSNLSILLRELPIEDSDVIRVPTLWKDNTYPWPRSPDGIPTRLRRAYPGQRQLQTFHPSAVNGIVLGSDYVAPKPWGPLVDGKDVLEDAIRAAYASADMKTVFIDNYMSHHVRGGEVHCATNTLRDTNIAWWTMN